VVFPGLAAISDLALAEVVSTGRESVAVVPPGLVAAVSLVSAAVGPPESVAAAVPRVSAVVVFPGLAAISDLALAEVVSTGRESVAVAEPEWEWAEPEWEWEWERGADGNFQYRPDSLASER
jgi:hypothetical protein